MFAAAHVSFFFFSRSGCPRDLHSFPTRRSSDLVQQGRFFGSAMGAQRGGETRRQIATGPAQANEGWGRSEEHTSELQSLTNLVCRLLLEKKKRRARYRRCSTASACCGCQTRRYC